MIKSFQAGFERFQSSCTYLFLSMDPVPSQLTLWSSRADNQSKGRTSQLLKICLCPVVAPVSDALWDLKTTYLTKRKILFPKCIPESADFKPRFFFHTSARSAETPLSWADQELSISLTIAPVYSSNILELHIGLNHLLWNTWLKLTPYVFTVSCMHYSENI